MLNSKVSIIKSGRFVSIVYLAALLILSSCNPTPIKSKLSTDPVTDSNNNTGSGYPNPSYPLAGTFVQEGNVRTTTSFVLPLDFNDSFMLRGDALSTYLRTIPNTTKFCMVGKFNYISGTDKFLILSAAWGYQKNYRDITPFSGFLK